MMTYRELLRDASESFAASETPFLDAVLLLAESLGEEKERVLAMLPERVELVPEAFYLMTARRQRGESVAHILGRKEFYGREFLVSNEVLSPRQDTEVLVEVALAEGDGLLVDAQAHRGMPEIVSRGRLRVLDLCTGSGAVAISIAAERPEWSVTASDISPGALDIARKNAAHLLSQINVTFIESDLFSCTEGIFDVITANPPYVPHHEAAGLIEEGWTDPILALDGGPDGMRFIRDIIAQSAEYLSRNGVLLLEMDPSQASSTMVLFQERGFNGIRTWNDLAGRIRVVGAHNG